MDMRADDEPGEPIGAPGARHAGSGGGSRSPGRPFVVLKFGGTSVSTADRWETIAKVVRGHLARGRRPLLVCSALSQVSNRLEALLAAAEAGEETSGTLDALFRVHARLASALGVDCEQRLGPRFAELGRLLRGASLTGEATPRLRARVMACGELMSTALGAAWLESQGLPTAWQDARELLRADPVPPGPGHEIRQYLSATCPHGHRSDLAQRLAALPEAVILTQGFIARAPDGATALLGRGGSDTSAAYLAAQLGAERLEIWSDVPGLFTAHPERVPDARLLHRVGYAEAAEISTRGAEVLHPRCLAPLRDAGVPLALRCTHAPDRQGTLVTSRGRDEDHRILAVTARRGMALVSMDVEGSWQRIGLIADLAGCFKRHGFSIDTIASSQTNVTVALDPAANRLEPSALAPLLADLARISTPRVAEHAAAVSVIGSSVRALLHELGPILGRLRHEPVRMLAHAANDLSLTLIVDESAADRVVRELHGALFATGRHEGESAAEASAVPGA